MKARTIRPTTRTLRWAATALLIAIGGCGSGDKGTTATSDAASVPVKERSSRTVGAKGGTAEERLGIDAATAGRDSIDSVITGSGFGLIGSIVVPFKALPIADRADVVRALALCLQAYYQSDEFKGDYAKVREQRKPQPPSYQRTPEQEVDDANAESRKQMAEARKTLLPMLPEANRAEVEQSYADNEKSLDDPVMRQYRLNAVQSERAQHMAEFENSMQTWQQTYPEDPQPVIVQRLRDFIALADSVDFDAELVVKDGKKHFAKPEYESKSSDWKWAFRTGRESVHAAREVAASWLAELK